MGFPSPAADFAEERLSVDGMFNKRPGSIFRADFEAVQAGLSVVRCCGLQQCAETAGRQRYCRDD